MDHNLLKSTQISRWAFADIHRSHSTYPSVCVTVLSPEINIIWMFFWSLNLHIRTSHCGSAAVRKWTVCWARITNYRGREDWGPAKHASFNEPVTEAGLSSINTMSMCMHAHTLAYTPICLDTDTPNTLMLSRPHAGMHGCTHAHTQVAHKSRALPHKHSFKLTCLGAHPNVAFADIVTWIQNNSRVNTPGVRIIPHTFHLANPFITQDSASFAQCLLSGHITAGMNRLLVIFLQPQTVQLQRKTESVVAESQSTGSKFLKKASSDLRQ